MKVRDAAGLRLSFDKGRPACCVSTCCWVIFAFQPTGFITYASYFSFLGVKGSTDWVGKNCTSLLRIVDLWNFRNITLIAEYVTGICLVGQLYYEHWLCE